MCDATRTDSSLSALVINLDRATGRMSHMARALDALALPHDRLPAVTPETVPEAAREIRVSEAGSR